MQLFEKIKSGVLAVYATVRPHVFMVCVYSVAIVLVSAMVLLLFAAPTDDPVFAVLAIEDIYVVGKCNVAIDLIDLSDSSTQTLTVGKLSGALLAFVCDHSNLRYVCLRNQHPLVNLGFNPLGSLFNTDSLETVAVLCSSPVLVGESIDNAYPGTILILSADDFSLS